MARGDVRAGTDRCGAALAGVLSRGAAGGFAGRATGLSDRFVAFTGVVATGALDRAERDVPIARTSGAAALFAARLALVTAVGFTATAGSSILATWRRAADGLTGAGVAAEVAVADLAARTARVGALGASATGKAAALTCATLPTLAGDCGVPVATGSPFAGAAGRTARAGAFAAAGLAFARRVALGGAGGAGCASRAAGARPVFRTVGWRDSATG